MTHYNWDEALGAEGLLALTEEAVTPPRRGRVPLRRLAALAACVGLVLGLVNYQALAVGVQEVYRYFAGIGATTENGDTLWVLEEPVTWTEGDWTYQIDGTLQGGTLELEIQVGTPLSLGQMPWYVTQRPGERSLGHRLTLTAGEEVLFDEYHGIVLNSTLDALESSYYGYRREQGFRTTGLTVVSCRMTEPPAEGCVLRIGGGVCARRGTGRSPSTWCRRRRRPAVEPDLDAAPGGYDHPGGGGRFIPVRVLRQPGVAWAGPLTSPSSGSRGRAIPAATRPVRLNWTAPSGSRRLSRIHMAEPVAAVRHQRRVRLADHHGGSGSPLV